MSLYDTGLHIDNKWRSHFQADSAANCSHGTIRFGTGDPLTLATCLRPGLRGNWYLSPGWNVVDTCKLGLSPLSTSWSSSFLLFCSESLSDESTVSWSELSICSESLSDFTVCCSVSLSYELTVCCSVSLSELTASPELLVDVTLSLSELSERRSTDSTRSKNISTSLSSSIY